MVVRIVAVFVACVFAFLALYVLVAGGHGPIYEVADICGGIAIIAICVAVMKSSI